MNSRRGLGRGLASLIPEEKVKPASGLQEVPPDQIVPNPHQPRGPFREQELLELTASIQTHGIIQPLVVTQNPAGGYQLIAGERRWRAAGLAGLTQVPVIVKDVAPREMLELALVENIQREDLNALEEAQAYQQLMKEFGLSQAAAARRVGKSRSAVANKVRLLGAAPAIRAALLEAQLTEGHARALLGLEGDAEQTAALQVVLERELTVRQTEALVKRWRAGERQPTRAKPTPLPEVHALEERFQESLGTRVRLRTNEKGGGRVVIYYYSDEEFNALYQHLTGEQL
ncbi:MAG TPA: ParB/RepB/Spo0J family partition protein [Thermoflexia bacterium]|nr:ParB/RepB/Spo0J family partition protein [Thermoflexia bacterium]